KTHLLLAELLLHEHALLAQAQRCSGVAVPMPLFTALLNYRHTAIPEGSEARAADPRSVEIVSLEERTTFPLVLSVDDFSSGLLLTLQGTASFEVDRICALAHRALESLVDA